ncbi:hypothetical protein [Kangiella sp.]|uniref:hypothetical protein n=1 Tax=Kangiella sp. TaxID=1920245 RepID=UPI0019936654|nr:hypothetical protein [Kangiella sp.]MBD3652896.1 hypothetical protein [Kangiella sp.]
MKKLISYLVIAVFLFNASGCGTILHPERKGQVDGRIDPSIAVLDGLGLLLFLIPGIIAFAVDFNNGTIYLPGTQGSLHDDDGTRVVKFDGDLDIEELEAILEQETGRDLDLKKDLTMVMEPATIEEAQMRVVLINKSMNLNLAQQ